MFNKQLVVDALRFAGYTVHQDTVNGVTLDHIIKSAEYRVRQLQVYDKINYLDLDGIPRSASMVSIDFDHMVSLDNTIFNLIDFLRLDIECYKIHLTKEFSLIGMDFSK